MSHLEGKHKIGMEMVHPQAGIRFKVFEDNSGALTIASIPNNRPDMKVTNN